MNSKIDRPTVAIIVLNWNAADDTIECVTSLLNLINKNRRIIIVDNASRGDDITRFERHFGDTVDIVRTTENLGYAGGNNVGIQWARRKYDPHYYWVLNNDTTVEPNTLDHLLQRAKQGPRADIIGSRIQYWHSTSIYCLGGGTINFWTGIDRLWGARQDLQNAFQPPRFSYISGCSLFFSRPVRETLQGFDDQFFLYSEEADFCTRAKHKGFQMGYAPSAVVHHKASLSTGYQSSSYVYYFLRNKLFFMKKHASWLQWITFLPSFLVVYCGGFILLAIRRGKLPHFQSVFAALRDFATGRFGRREH